jgi:RNA polymerase sigma-70 factor (ECF subfamily)
MRSTPLDAFSPEHLAGHAAAVRALARALVGAQDADDVTQEVLLAAAGRSGGEVRNWRALLVRITQRLAWRRKRAMRRRTRHELAAAERHDPAPFDPSEIVALAEERQRIAAAVLELEEPFRTIVLLRWFEDLSPTEIAKRLRIPAATVRTRLFRAHALLRERFARERGPEWRAGLVAVAGLPPAAPVVWLGGWTFAAAALLLTTMAMAWWWSADAALPLVANAMVEVREPDAAGTAGSAVASLADPAAEQRVGIDAARGAAAAEPGEPAPVRIRGIAWDPLGRPIPSLAIALRGPKSAAGSPAEMLELGRTDAMGRFAIELPAAATRGACALVAGSGWRTLRSWAPENHQLASADDALLIACPEVRVRGRVVDEQGAPRAGVAIQTRCTEITTFPFATTGTQLELDRIGTTTAADGSFELLQAPGSRAVDLDVGPFVWSQPMPEHDVDDLLVVLRPRPVSRQAAKQQPQFTAVHGVVRATTGEPIPGARVVVDGNQEDVVQTGVDGSYRCSPWPLGAPELPIAVHFVADGYGAVTAQVWQWDAEGLARLDVQLARGMRSLHGRVVDQHGAPRQGLVVALADPLPLAAGSLQGCVEGGDSGIWGPHAVTDAAGAFAIPGVLERPYSVRVVEDAAANVVYFHGLHPAHEHRLEFAPQPRGRVALHCVGWDQRPLAGVEVKVAVVRRHVASSNRSETTYLAAEWQATSDADGLVAFAELPGGALQIRATRVGFESLVRDVSAGEERIAPLVLARLCHLRIATQDSRIAGLSLAETPSIVCLDADGSVVPFATPWRGQRRANGFSVQLRRGQSNVFAVSERMVRMELRGRDGTVLAAQQRALDPAAVSVFDFGAPLEDR